MGQATVSYLLRDVPATVWRKARMRALSEGHNMRQLLTGMLRDYGNKTTYREALPKKD